MAIKIGFDARMIEHSGIGIRIQHILKYWPVPRQKARLFIFGDEILLRKYELPEYATIISYTAGIYSVREWFGHPLMKDMELLDIPHFNVPIRYIRKCIVTIHDLIPYHFTLTHSSIIKRLYLNLVLRIIAVFAKKIIAVSNYTANDFKNHFPDHGDRIETIYNGFAPDYFYKHSAKDLLRFQSEHKLPKEYLLASGIGKKHKNFIFLLHNLTDLWKSRKLKLPLVVAGISKDIPPELIDAIEKNPGKIIILPHLAYSDLSYVYQGAMLFIFPSLFEGFGFPVIEAQAIGTPVLSSSATVLPEILGNSASFFDPENNQDFEDKLLALIANPEERKTFSKAGLINVKRFYWSDQIEKLLKSYENLLD